MPQKRGWRASPRGGCGERVKCNASPCLPREEKVRHLTVHCVLVPRTQPLICVGCAVHYWVSCVINKGGFLRLHFRRRHTFASLWGACLRFALLWRANSCGDSCVLGVHLSKVCWGLIFCLRKAFIFLKVCWIFVKRTSIGVCWIVQSVHLSEVCC